LDEELIKCFKYLDPHSVEGDVITKRKLFKNIHKLKKRRPNLFDEETKTYKLNDHMFIPIFNNMPDQSLIPPDYIFTKPKLLKTLKQLLQ